MCGTEVKFVTVLLDELKVDYPKPSMLFEDNTGAIFIMKNDQVGQRTKHIDVKFHHVRDMIKAGDLVVLYIRSEDNPADIMTKNTKEVLCKLLCYNTIRIESVVNSGNTGNVYRTGRQALLPLCLPASNRTAHLNETSHESEESRDVRAALASWRVLGSGCSASTLCASCTLF